jgi:hypothetical protein
MSDELRHPTNKVRNSSDLPGVGTELGGEAVGGIVEAIQERPCTDLH